jgi:hypothetical protein
MLELKDKILNRMGVAEAMGHRATQSARRLQQAADKHHDAANAEIADLAKQIQAKGVGQDEELEQRYCRALVTRSHMIQAGHLAQQDAGKMPEVGGKLEKGLGTFEEQAHPRAEHPEGNYRPGEFVPKGEAQGKDAEAKEESGHKEPWEMTASEFKDYQIPTDVSDHSRNPGDLDEYRESGNLLSDYVGDAYSLNEWLGKDNGNPKFDESRRLGDQVKRGLPLTIYRTTDAEGEIFPGAYVSLSKPYAQSHGESTMGKDTQYGGKFHMLQAKVYPDELYCVNAQEFFYVPRDLNKFHEASVKAAVKAGKPVPQNVLDEYGLQAKAQPPRDLAPKEDVEAVADAAEESGHPDLAQAHRDGHAEVEPHTMTRKAYMLSQDASGDQMRHRQRHMAAVRDALKEGKEVAPEVLADYPSLTKKEFTGKEEDPKEAWQLRQSDMHQAADLDKQYEANYLDANGEKIASSRTTPAKPDNLPLGSWRIDSWKGLYGKEISQLRELDPDDLIPSEDTDRPKHADVERYAEWAKEGKVAPPIEVLELPDGKLKVANGHRRWLAAKAAGTKVRAWVSPNGIVPGKFDSEGKPMTTGLTHELAVHHAIKSGATIPQPVLDEYQEMFKAMRSRFVPPDMPRWRNGRPEGDAYLPLNGVEDRYKFRAMVEEMEKGTWKWSKPLIRCGDQLLTGSHRYAAAKVAGTPLVLMDVDDVFSEGGLDFKETWEKNAQPWDGWLSNLDYALKCLPDELREKYGIDLG